MVMMQMQAQLQGNNATTVMHDSSDIPELAPSQQTEHAREDEAGESTSHNNYKTSKDSNTSDIEVSWLSTHESSGDQILPVILKMTKFTEKRKNKEPWYSDPFFVSRDGCQMCLRVDSSGYKNSYISVYLYTKDLHDITIKHHGHCNWPLRGKFAIELLNQFSDNIHHRQNLMITNNPGIDKNINENLLFSGWGCYNFISHNILSKSSHIYSRNDTLYFRILYEDTPTNVVRTSTLQILSDYFNEYLHTPLLLLSLLCFIADAVQNWITNYRILMLTGMIMLLLLILIGTYVIGNLVGGMLWVVAILLIARFIMTTFPDQQYLGLFSFLLTTAVVKILLVDVLHMPWGLIWGIL